MLATACDDEPYLYQYRMNVPGTSQFEVMSHTYKRMAPTWIWSKSPTIRSWSRLHNYKKQKAVTAYFSSEQLLPFGFARQSTWPVNHLETIDCFFITIRWENLRSAYASQQARAIEPMLGQCWADVVDGRPTLTQHWFNGSCLLANQPFTLSRSPRP